MALFFRGGGFLPPTVTFPCAGMPLHLTAPNDFSNAAWTNQNLSIPPNTETDPFFVVANAGQFIALATNFCHVLQPVTITAGATYELSGYFKYISGPSFILIGLMDGSSYAHYALAHFDFQNGLVSNTEADATSAVSCAQIQAAGNGYFQFSIAGSLGSFTTSNVILRPTTAGDGTNDQATINQQFYYYTVGL